MILKVVPSVEVQAPILESLVCKIMKSKDEVLLKYAGFLIGRMNTMRFADLICKGLSDECLKATLEAEVKTYIFLRLEGGFWRDQRNVNLCDFTYQFRVKYKALAEQLGLAAGELLVKKTRKEGGIDLVEFIPNSSIDYAYSKYLNREFLAFTPPNYLLLALQLRIQALVDDFTGNARYLKDLKKIIYNCPFLLHAITLQPVLIEKQE